MNLPFLIFSDSRGRIYRHPYLRMAGSGFKSFQAPKAKELMRLPERSALFYMPGRAPVGFDPITKRFEQVSAFKGKRVFAVSASPIPGILRLYNPATIAKDRKLLSLWGYSACGEYSGRFYLAGRRVDKRVRQSPRFYDNKIIAKAVRRFYTKYPNNRLYGHLANCALNYNCLAAKNLFLERWEAPLPTARFCNAGCLGCLSYQTGGCGASHKRINFKPKVSEIAQVMGNHLKKAREAIASFGQGCEGEPLLEADVIADAIYKVRAKISRGTINMNTNASLPKKVEELCKAGMDSFRVSLNSPDERCYNIYFKPRNYKFRDVLESIAAAKKHRKFVSINLFIFPGFTDSEFQAKSLFRFIKNTGIDMIQWRNLNIDPDYYRKIMPCESQNSLGISGLLKAVQQQFPRLKTGYFNLPKNSKTSIIT